MPNPGHNLPLKYPSALVTGASSGIGRAVAELLAGIGVQVVGTSRFPDRPELPESIRWIRFEGSSPDEVAKFCGDNSQLLSSVDILINNSGSSCFGKESEIPGEVLQRQHCLLLEAPKKLTLEALPHMSARGCGAIVNVSSLAALFVLPYMESYSRCKAGLSKFTRQIISSSRGTGVTIIDFQPGDYRTNFNRNVVRYGDMDPQREQVWRRYEKNLNAAPSAARAARDIVKALESGVSRTVRSGSFFQSKVAAPGVCMLPASAAAWATRKYFGLP